MDDLAPRIKSLKAERKEVEAQQRSLLYVVTSAEQHCLTAEAIAAYAADLSGLLGKGTLMERKAFLRSFVKKIVLGPEQAQIEYTLPLKAE